MEAVAQPACTLPGHLARLRAYLLQFDRKLLHTLFVFLDHLLDLLLLLDYLVPHFQLTLISVAECVRPTPQQARAS